MSARDHTTTTPADTPVATAAATARVPTGAAASSPAASAAADGDDDAVDLSSLLAPTARSRPVMVHQSISLSTQQTRRSRLTAVDSNARALLVAATTGTLYAYQKPNPALLLQAAAAATTAVAAAAAAANRVGLLKLVSRTKDAITHVRCWSATQPHTQGNMNQARARRQHADRRVACTTVPDSPSDE